MSARTPRILVATAVTAAAVVVAALLVSGGPSGGGDRAPTSSGTAAPTAAGVKPTVIVISVDGFNQDALSKLTSAQTRWFMLMRRHGTYTTNARTAVEQTNTLPNHTGMITGRPIEGPHGHHVVFNSDKPSSWIAKENGGRYIPSIFDVAHDRGMSTALYTSKDKFKFLDRSYDATHGAPDRVGADNGRDKIGSFYLAKPDAVATHLRASLTSSHRRNLYFWHISLPDEAGHHYGFMSKKYLAAVAHTNTLLGQIFTTLQADKALLASTSVVLTADHGGKGPSHRDATKVYNYKVPLYTWGRGVQDGVGLYVKNTARRYPGTSRPSYAGAQPIRNMDVANTSLRLLGLPSLAAGATPALRTE